MVPEYVFNGLFSTKSDVFSFGILLLEIISGKKSRGFFHPNHIHKLIGYVSFKYLDFLPRYIGHMNDKSCFYILSPQTPNFTTCC